MGDLDKLAVKGNFLDRLARLERLVERMERREIVADSLEEISADLGAYYSGRLMAITAADATSVEANGAFFDADGVVFSDGQTYHVGGVHNGQLMFGLRAEDGAGVFAGGAGVIDSDGQHMTGIRYALEHLASDPDGANLRRGAIEMFYPDGSTIPAYRIVFGDGGEVSELVTNGDFSNGTTSWTATLTGASTFSVSLMVDVGYQATLYRAPGQNASVVSDGFAVSPGKAYRARLKASGSGADSVAITGRVDWLDGSAALIGSSVILSASRQQTGGEAHIAEMSVDVGVTAPASAATARVYLTVTAGGSIVFRTVSVQLRTIQTGLVFDDNGFSLLRWGAEGGGLGRAHNRNTTSSYTSQIMIMRVIYPIRVTQINWDIRNTGSYELRLLWETVATSKLRLLWSGSVAASGFQAMPFQKPEILLPGLHYFGLVRSGAATWWDYNATSYAEGEEMIPPYSNPAYYLEQVAYNDALFNFVPCARPIFRRGEWS